jgi:hypothetical protein
MKQVNPSFGRKAILQEYQIKYEWQRREGLGLPVHLLVYEAVMSGNYHSQAEVAEACFLDQKYAGKILSQLRAAGVIDKVWVVKEDEENVDL